MKVIKPNFNKFVEQYMEDSKISDTVFERLSYITQLNIIESYKSLPQSVELTSEEMGETNV